MRALCFGRVQHNDPSQTEQANGESVFSGTTWGELVLSSSLGDTRCKSDAYLKIASLVPLCLDGWGVYHFLLSLSLAHTFWFASGMLVDLDLSFFLDASAFVM